MKIITSIKRVCTLIVGVYFVLTALGCGGGGGGSGASGGGDSVSSNSSASSGSNASSGSEGTSGTASGVGVNRSAAQPIKLLVLYDAPANQPTSKLGLGYAIMLRNLLGHFDTVVDLLPVDQYTAGKVEGYQTTFYLGSYSDNPLPKAFFSDINQTQKTVVWFKYNLGQMAWDASYNFDQHFGFKFLSNRGLDGVPSANTPNPGFFDTVQYKNVSMVKYYAFNATTGVVSADPVIGATQVTDSAKAQTLVTITDSHTQEQMPYILKSSNFWYFADVPLSFTGSRDRYLVLCDILHDILGVNHAVSHKALVRLEDISFLSSSASLKTLSDYMSSKNVPFSMALIPFFRDPLGHYNGGVSKEVHLADAPNLKSSLQYALAHGGKIVMHGYTHQYASIANIQSGVSGEDFEFWNAVNNTPVAEDSTAWAGGRLDAGLKELSDNDFTPFAWEAPHYNSSPLSIKAVPSRFSKTYQRVTYYTSDIPQLLNTGQTNQDFAMSQFFPYAIKSDYYGQTIIPENLGNIQSNTTWQDIQQNAQVGLVVRDGVASFFFHPYLLNVGSTGLSDFQSLIDGISSLGYEWADASTF